MQDFGAEYAVLAILGFEVAVATERAGGHMRRKGAAQVEHITPKTCIQDGNLESSTTIATGMPACHAEPGQMLSTLQKRVGRNDADF